MALPNGADVEIGGVSYRLDQAYERITGRRCYVHGGRSIFAGRTDITGRPGAQNLKEDFLVWTTSRFDGEGQVVLDPADRDSAFRFYRSEGLNFRTPGQAKLNKSTISTQVLADNAGTTQQGAADFTDVTGTSTTSSDDRKLVAVGDIVGSSANVSYASARTIQLDFYLFRDGFSTGATTVQASAMRLAAGEGASSGTDYILEPASMLHTTVKSVGGGHFTAGVVQRVEFYYDALTTNDIRRWVDTGVTIYDETTGKVVAAKQVSIAETTSALGSPRATLTFTPITGHDYRFRVRLMASPRSSTFNTFTVDKVVFGPEITENKATITLYNQTGTAVVTSKTVNVNVTAKGRKVASIGIAVAASTNYRARVTRTSGQQPIWVDKVVWNDDNGATGSWVIDAVDLGLGSQSAGVFTPKVWAAAHASGVDNQVFVWNSSTDVWDAGATLDSPAGTNNTVRAMAHSDAREYALLSSNEVISWTAAGADTNVYDTFTGGVGLAVAQDRLWILSEGTNITIYSCALEPAGATPVDVTTDTTDTRKATVATATKTPDTALRQRMCGTPTGVRYFVNNGDVSAIVYETDGSGTTLVTRQLADLGAGVKATCIAHESGITFVGAQYYGESGASDSDRKPRAVLFAIDQNGVVQRIGFMRKDSPDVRPPAFLFPYQTDLYILQGKYVWRYSLVSGGLFLEYELDPQSPAKARSLAVLFGQVFAVYDDEIFVAGSEGTYRAESVADGNSITTSVYDYGLPAVKKALARIDVTSDTLASNATIKVEYQTDQSGTWVLAGTHTSGASTSFYVVETTFTTLQLRATLISEDGTATPVLRGMTVWASAAEDEEYFDLVLLTEDEDSNFRIAGQQDTGENKSSNIVSLWRRKAVTTFKDGYASRASEAGQDYLVTIEDLRVEQNSEGEGRTVVTLKVVR